MIESERRPDSGAAASPIPDELAILPSRDAVLSSYRT